MLLGRQRVVKGRAAHMAGVHTAPVDIKLLAQTQLQIICAAGELEGTNAHL